MRFDPNVIAELIRTGAMAAEHESLISEEDRKLLEDYAERLEEVAKNLLQPKPET